MIELKEKCEWFRNRNELNWFLIVLAKDDITESEDTGQIFHILDLNILSDQFIIDDKVQSARGEVHVDTEM